MGLFTKLLLERGNRSYNINQYFVSAVEGEGRGRQCFCFACSGILRACFELGVSPCFASM